MSDGPDAPALDAAERALEALGRKDPASARTAVATAVARDRGGRLAPLADAVFLAAFQLEENGEITESTWNQLADAVGPGRLQATVEQIR